MRELIDDSDKRFPLLAEVQQGQPEQHREKEHLQNLAFGERVHDRGRNDVQEKVDRAQMLSIGGVGCHDLGIKRGRIGVDAHAGLEHVDHDEANHQREGRDDLEIDERPDTNPADVLHVAHLCDAHHHCRKDDGRDEHADQLDETVTQGPHGRAGAGPEVS